MHREAVSYREGNTEPASLAALASVLIIPLFSSMWKR